MPKTIIGGFKSVGGMSHRPNPGGQTEHFFTVEMSMGTIGFNQATRGEIITSPTDRQAIAKLLQLVASSPQAIAGIRGEMLNNKYPENMKWNN